MKVYSKKKAAAKNPFAGGSGLFGAAPVHQPVETAPVGGQKKDEEPKSMFRIAISHGQQGLAYLMMDQGYNMMHAMQDSLDEKKFQLVLTLLSKVSDDKIVQQKTSKGQSLFHILSQNAVGCKYEHLRRIYDTFKKRGVNCLETDNFNRSALHYAVISR